MNFFQQLMRQARDFWLSQSGPRRVMIGSGAAVIALVAVGVAYFSLQADYRPLFTGLSPEEAGAVTAKLTTQGVTYRLSSGGTTILVPADQLQQAKISLASEGVPARGGKGWDLLDDMTLGATPFQQNASYQRALQSELAKSIMQIDPIASARVIIARPESSVFLRDQKPTTASVVLTLRPRSTLNPSVTGAIVALVARSVEGLKPENVALIDSAGRVLSKARARDDDLAEDQLEHRKKLESYLESKAEEMLTKSLGFGRAIVKVTAEIDHKQVKQRDEKYDPQDKAASHEVSTSSKQMGSGRSSGAAGVVSNTGRTPAASGGGGSSNSSDESVETDYQVSKSVRESEDKTSVVERLTVAAMVDLATPAGESPSATPLTIAEVEAIIKQAVGFKKDRDEIKVSDVRLANAAVLPPEPDEEALALQRFEAYVIIARNISLGLSALLSVVLGFMLVLRLKPRVITAPSPEPSPEEFNELAVLARNDPALVAELLAGMMNEA